MTVLRHAAVAVLLALAGVVCWALGDAERRVASTEEQLATLNSSATTESSGRVSQSLARLPWVGGDLEAVARQDRAAGAYWQGDYAALAPSPQSAGPASAQDPEVLFVAANAAYRAMDVDGADRQTVVQALDRLVKRYAEILQQSAHQDAAFNYEYLARLRDVTAKSRGPVGSVKPDLTGSTGTHPTIHGHVGGPPKGVEMQQFKVMVPKRSDERKEGMEPGKGAAKERKG